MDDDEDQDIDEMETRELIKALFKRMVVSKTPFPKYVQPKKRQRKSRRSQRKSMTNETPRTLLEKVIKDKAARRSSISNIEDFGKSRIVSHRKSKFPDETQDQTSGSSGSDEEDVYEFPSPKRKKKSHSSSGVAARDELDFPSSSYSAQKRVSKSSLLGASPLSISSRSKNKSAHLTSSQKEPSLHDKKRTSEQHDTPSRFLNKQQSQEKEFRANSSAKKSASPAKIQYSLPLPDESEEESSDGKHNYNKSNPKSAIDADNPKSRSVSLTSPQKKLVLDRSSDSQYLSKSTSKRQNSLSTFSNKGQSQVSLEQSSKQIPSAKKAPAAQSKIQYSLSFLSDESEEESSKEKPKPVKAPALEIAKDTKRHESKSVNSSLSRKGKSLDRSFNSQQLSKSVSKQQNTLPTFRNEQQSYISPNKNTKQNTSTRKSAAAQSRIQYSLSLALDSDDSIDEFAEKMDKSKNPPTAKTVSQVDNSKSMNTAASVSSAEDTDSPVKQSHKKSRSSRLPISDDSFYDVNTDKIHGVNVDHPKSTFTEGVAVSPKFNETFVQDNPSFHQSNSKLKPGNSKVSSLFSSLELDESPAAIHQKSRKKKKEISKTSARNKTLEHGRNVHLISEDDSSAEREVISSSKLDDNRHQKIVTSPHIISLSSKFVPSSSHRKADLLSSGSVGQDRSKNQGTSNGHLHCENVPMNELRSSLDNGKSHRRLKKVSSMENCEDELQKVVSWLSKHSNDAEFVNSSVDDNSKERSVSPKSRDCEDFEEAHSEVSSGDEKHDLNENESANSNLSRDNSVKQSAVNSKRGSSGRKSKTVIRERELSSQEESGHEDNIVQQPSKKSNSFAEAASSEVQRQQQSSPTTETPSETWESLSHVTKLKCLEKEFSFKKQTSRQSTPAYPRASSKRQSQKIRASTSKRAAPFNDPKSPYNSPRLFDDVSPHKSRNRAIGDFKSSTMYGGMHSSPYKEGITEKLKQLPLELSPIRLPPDSNASVGSKSESSEDVSDEVGQQSASGDEEENAVVEAPRADLSRQRSLSGSERVAMERRRKKRSADAKIPQFPISLTRSIFEDQSGMRVVANSGNILQSCLHSFFQTAFSILEAYAKHGGRKVINMSDFELYLYRLNLARDRNSLNALIVKNLPMRMRAEVIPMATAGNVVVPR